MSKTVESLSVFIRDSFSDVSIIIVRQRNMLNLSKKHDTNPKEWKCRRKPFHCVLLSVFILNFITKQSFIRAVFK